MILYIVRHAWAVEADDPSTIDDASRPLTDEGRRRFRALVRCLSSAGMTPAHIATSPLVRCRETADILVRRLQPEPELSVLEELAPGAKLESLLAWTREHASGDVAWVGHSPDVGQLAAELIGDLHANLRFAKGAVAAIKLLGEPAAGRGELKWMVTAKVMGV